MRPGCQSLGGVAWKALVTQAPSEGGSGRRGIAQPVTPAPTAAPDLAHAHPRPIDRLPPDGAGPPGASLPDRRAHAARICRRELLVPAPRGRLRAWRRRAASGLRRGSTPAAARATALRCWPRTARRASSAVDLVPDVVDHAAATYPRGRASSRPTCATDPLPWPTATRRGRQLPGDRAPARRARLPGRGRALLAPRRRAAGDRHPQPAHVHPRHRRRRVNPFHTHEFTAEELREVLGRPGRGRRDARPRTTARGSPPSRPCAGAAVPRPRAWRPARGWPAWLRARRRRGDGRLDFTSRPDDLDASLDLLADRQVPGTRSAVTSRSCSTATCRGCAATAPTRSVRSGCSRPGPES